MVYWRIDRKRRRAVLQAEHGQERQELGSNIHRSNESMTVMRNDFDDLHGAEGELLAFPEWVGSGRHGLGD